MKPFMLLILLLCVGLVELQRRGPRRDSTRMSETVGEEVVTAVVRLIRGSNIFPEDNQLLRRIALVESMDGTDSNTFRRDYHGGIWQVDQIDFEDTKDTMSHPSLVQRHSEIFETFRINWTIAKWEDLRIPLYSGLAARLFLSNIAEEIPVGIENQARYWKQYYNTPQGAGTEQDFIDKAQQLASEQSTSCTINADLMFVMDASGSVGRDNFEEMKDFVRNFANGLEIGRDKNQVGVIVYSDDAIITIQLNAHSTKAALLTAIDNTAYTDGGTNTAEALRTLINSFLETNGARPEALRIAIVMTDGRSNSFSQTLQEAQNLHRVVPPILSYAIGIGDNINQQELEAIASRPQFIVQLTSFNPNEFTVVQEQRTQEICFEVSTPVNPGDSRGGAVGQGESQRLQFPITDEGLTVRLCVTMGRIIFYAARSMTPNEAFYDWRIVSEAGCNTVRLNPNEIDSDNRRKRRQAGGSDTLFVTIQGDRAGTNSFALDSTADKPGQTVQIEPKTQETVTEGESISFSCLGSDPSSIVVERRTGSADVSSLTSFGSRLRMNGTSPGRVHYIIEPLLAEDHNTFLYCSSGVFISTEVLLTVYFSPRYLAPQSPLTIIDGSASTLTFELQGNPAATEYHWYKDGAVLSPSFRVNIQADSLTFNPVYVGDTGSYAGIAGNYLGNGTLSFQLIVDYAPVFTERFGTFSCQETGDLIECLAPAGSSGYLKCIAFGRPRAMIDLETRIGSTNNVQFDKESGDVVIRSVSNDNKGFYTCVARNSVAEVRRTFLLLVGDGYLPPVEDLQVTVQRNQDNLYLAVKWRYNTSSLSFPPANFHVSIYSILSPQRTQPLHTWMLPRETFSLTRSLASLSLRPQTAYRVEVYSQNALGSSKAVNSFVTFPRCPPLCSTEFCTNRRTRTALCTIPSTMRMSNCSVLCPVTFCHACYFGREARNVSALSCTSCSGYDRDALTRESKCFKRWAKCIRLADFNQYGKLPKAQRVSANFRCYEHPCV